MARVAAGDRYAYDTLYARWSASTFTFLLRRTGSRARAEEALQETWLRVFRHGRTFQNGRKFAPWVFAIAANAGRDARRPEPDLLHLEGEAADPGELRDRLVAALHLLDPLDRRLLLLAVEGFTSVEIGEMVRVNPTAVRMRLSRARASLREALGDADA